MNTLIVETNNATRTLLKSYVRQWDPTGQIYEAATPPDTLAKLRTVDYIDVVTINQNEKVKGLDLLSYIQELKPNSHIVMITNECTPEFKKLAIKYELELVCKPISSSKLKKFFVT